MPRIELTAEQRRKRALLHALTMALRDFDTGPQRTDVIGHATPYTAFLRPRPTREEFEALLQQKVADLIPTFPECYKGKKK